MEKVLSEIFDLLLAKLLGPDYEMRRKALVALTRLQGQVAAEVVFERYQSDNLEDYLSLAVSRLDPERASKLLIAALNDSQMEIRISAAEALKEMKNEVATRVLVEAADNYCSGAKKTENDTRLVSEDAIVNAVIALGQIGNYSCTRVLRKLITVEKNPRIRACAVAALGKKPDEKAIPFFQGILKDPDPRVRSAAIEAIDRSKSKSVVGILQPYLDDPNQRIRANAAIAVFKYGDFEVTATLKEMLKSPDSKQRISAIYAIGEIRSEGFLGAIQGYLDDPDLNVRRNALIALKKFNRPEIFEKLTGLLDDETEEIRLHMIHAMVAVLKEKALPMLAKRLKKESSPVARSLLITEMGKLGGASVFAEIYPFMKDDDGRVVGNVVEAIYKSFPENPPDGVADRMKLLLSSGISRIRANSIKALWAWGHAEVLPFLKEMLANSDHNVQMSGLHCLGEVFAMVSVGKHLPVFEKELKKTIEAMRSVVRRKSAKAAHERLQVEITEVQEILQRGDRKEAAFKLMEILRAAPNHLQALILLGEILLQDGNLAGAKGYLESAVAIQPNLGKVQFSLGRIYHETRQWEKATKALLETIKINPKLPQPYLLLSESLEKENRISDCLSVLRKLQVLVPQNPAVMLRLAKISLMAGSIGEAVQWARTAAGLGSISPLSCFIMAIGDHNENKSDDGFRKLLQVLKSVLQNPSSSPAMEIQQCPPVVEKNLQKK